LAGSGEWLPAGVLEMDEGVICLRVVSPRSHPVPDYIRHLSQGVGGMQRGWGQERHTKCGDLVPPHARGCGALQYATIFDHTLW